MICTLCSSDTSVFFTQKKQTYFYCNNCQSILLDSKNFLVNKDEKVRYDKHSDNIEDKGYVNFVTPIIKAVCADFTPNNSGLDYGCGNSAIIEKILQQKDYQINGFDPFYKNDTSVLSKKYDYITCCEVAEHFYSPEKEFQKLRNLLLPKGKLYLKTNLYTNKIDFKNWWYKNDPTHVFFYTKNSMEYIRDEFGFKKLDIFDDCIVLTKT